MRANIGLFAIGLFSMQVLAAPALITDSSEGEILTNHDGMSLYVFEKDEAGVSHCNDKCTDNWPILAASKDDKAEDDYDIITRADGSLQWTYQDQPLYLWKEDKVAGDMKGNGKFDVWHLAKP